MGSRRTRSRVCGLEFRQVSVSAFRVTLTELWDKQVHRSSVKLLNLELGSG